MTKSNFFKFITLFYWIIFLTINYLNYFDVITFDDFYNIFFNFISLLIFGILFLKKIVFEKLTKDVLICILIAIPLLVLKIMPKDLEAEEHKIIVSHTAFGCECADWNILEQPEYIYLEPQNKNLTLPEIAYSTNPIVKVEVVGHFYKRKGFPKDNTMQGFPDKARVFRYYKFRILH